MSTSCLLTFIDNLWIEPVWYYLPEPGNCVQSKIIDKTVLFTVNHLSLYRGIGYIINRVQIEHQDRICLKC